MLYKVGNGAPILFLHGFLGSHKDWEKTISFLQDSFSCLSIDLPGHGKVSVSEDWQGDIFRILDQNKWTRVHLVGYSMGGRLAMQMAQKAPERFSKKIFFSAHPGLSDPDEKEKRAIEENTWIQMIKEREVDSFIDLWYGQELFSSLKQHPDFSSTLERRKFQEKEGVIAALDTMRLSKQAQYIPESSSLFVYGEKDLKYAKLYTTLASHAKVFSIPLSGHALPIENPKACADFIQKHLGDL